MDLKQLEYFVHVAELGSFTRASIALNVAQAALSRQVRLLEVELRQSLLIRNGRGVTTSEAGKVMLEHGRGVLHQVERAREEVGRVRGALVGRVALGLPPSLSKVLTVPLIRAFGTRMPEASLSITEELSATMREALITGQLDIAMLYNFLPSPDIEAYPLLEEDLYLVRRRQGRGVPRPVSLRAVADEPLVIPTRPNALRMLVEVELAHIGCRPRIVLEINGVAAILDLVADGAGCAVLSMNAITTSGRPEAFIAHRIVKPRLRRKLVLAVSSRRPATRTQQSILELIRQVGVALLRTPVQPEGQVQNSGGHP